MYFERLIPFISYIIIAFSEPNKIATRNMETGQVFVRVVKLKGPPDNVGRLRVSADRILLRHKQSETDLPIYHIQLRWTPPTIWGDADGDLADRKYQIQCRVKEENATEDKTLFHVDIPEFYTGYDESFRLPSNTFEIRCSVRARNSFDLPSEWTKGPLIKIDNRKSNSPTTSTLLDNEVKTEKKRSYEAIVQTKNVPRKFLNIEDLSQDELLKLLKASILENLTPKKKTEEFSAPERVNLEEFKKAGRRLEEIFVTRKPIDYEEEGFPRFEMDNGHESKVETKEETFVNLNELGNAVEVIPTITEKPLEKVIPTKDTKEAYFRLYNIMSLLYFVQF